MQNQKRDDGTKMMRVPTALHEVVSEMAAVDRRTLGAELAWIVEAGLRAVGAGNLAERLAESEVERAGI